MMVTLAHHQQVRLKASHFLCNGIENLTLNGQCVPHGDAGLFSLVSQPRHGALSFAQVPGDGITPAPAIIRCSYSINSAISNAVLCIPATCTAPTGWDGTLKPVVVRYQGKVSRINFGADAGFANPEVYEFLEAEHIKYAIRYPPTKFCSRGSATCSSARSGDLRTRCDGSMPISPIRREAGLSRGG
jgi:hypothetical protein